MEKKRYGAFDYVKLVAAAIVIFDHFGIEIQARPHWHQMPGLLVYNSISWEIAVSLFFAASGALLFLHHSDISLKELPQFYKKRFAAIFPPFLLVWGTVFVIKAMEYHSFFYVKPEASILLSFIGMDGYFFYLGPNYYSVGEWFLGAIIFVYLLYPLLAKLFSKGVPRIITTVALLLGTAFVYQDYVLGLGVFKVYPFRNMIVCVLTVWIGMLLMKYHDFFKKTLVMLPALIFLLFQFFVKAHLPLSFFIFEEELQLICVFSVFFWLKDKLPKIPGLDRVAHFISSLAFEIFLLQHLIITWISSTFTDLELTKKQELLLLLLIYVVILILAKVLQVVTKSVTGVFRRKEQKE